MARACKLYGVEWLRGISALAIVGCHEALPKLTEGALWIKSFTDLFVGVFAMLSGLFFLSSCSKLNSLRDCFLKKGGRILIPYFVWTFIYVAVDLVMDIVSAKPQLSFQPQSIEYWTSIVLQGNGSAHLWFLICLFYALMLAFVILIPLMRNIGKVWFCSMCLLSGFLFVALCEGGWYRIYFLRLLGFFLIGVGFSVVKNAIQRIPNGVWICASIVGCGLIGTGMVYGKLGECVLSVPLVLAAITWKCESNKLQKIGIWLGSTSFGVYLIHLMFTIAFRDLILKFGLEQNTVVYMCDIIVAWLMSLGVVSLVSVLKRRFSCLNLIFP